MSDDQIADLDRRVTELEKWRESRKPVIRQGQPLLVAEDFDDAPPEPDDLVQCPWCHGRGDGRGENNEGWTCSQCDGDHEVPRSIAALHPDYIPPEGTVPQGEAAWEAVGRASQEANRAVQGGMLWDAYDSPLIHAAYIAGAKAAVTKAISVGLARPAVTDPSGDIREKVYASIRKHVGGDDYAAIVTDDVMDVVSSTRTTEPLVVSDATWEPMDREDAMSSVGMGVHTGLRKGTEAPGSHELWVAINDSDAWADAVRYYIETLYEYGGAICKRTSDVAEGTSDG